MIIKPRQYNIERLARTGIKEDLPKLNNGEIGFCLDTEEFFMGTKIGNKQIMSFDDLLEALKLTVK